MQDTGPQDPPAGRRIATLAEALKAVETGTVLMHGLSLDALSGVLRDGEMDPDVRCNATGGVSLTRSLHVAVGHARSQELHFDEVLMDHYGHDAGRKREPFGAVLVFRREDLADLSPEPFDEDGEGSEHEERVWGAVDRVRDRVAAVICDPAELGWFGDAVRACFASAGEDVSWLPDFLATTGKLSVDRERLSFVSVPAREGGTAPCP